MTVSAEGGLAVYGEKVAGPVGPQGPQGIQGPAGAAGAAGAQGPAGPGFATWHSGDYIAHSFATANVMNPLCSAFGKTQLQGEHCR